MSYTNARIPTFSDDYRYPVQFETPKHMTGAHLDDGRGILVWHDGMNVRVGFVDSPSQWAVNGSCTSATTVLTPDATGAIMATSCFRVGTGLYILVCGYGASYTGYNLIYKANSASNPTSWALHGTIQYGGAATANGLLKADPAQGGIPYVDGSTWTMPFARWQNYLGNRYIMPDIWRSTDGGVTWAVALNTGYGTNGNSDNTYTCPHIGREPSTGYLYWVSSGIADGAVAQEGLFESRDGGATWSVAMSNIAGSTDGTQRYFMPWGDDGSDLYGGRAGPSGGGVYRFDAFGDPSFYTQAAQVSDYPMHPGTASRNSHFYERICTDGRGRFYSFQDDRVLQGSPGRRPSLGRIGFG